MAVFPSAQVSGTKLMGLLAFPVLMKVVRLVSITISYIGLVKVSHRVGAGTSAAQLYYNTNPVWTRLTLFAQLFDNG